MPRLLFQGQKKKAINPERVIKKILFLACCSLMAVSLRGQSTDLIRTDFTYLPEGKTGNVVSRFRFAANAPIKLSQGEYLIVGAEYGHVGLDIRRSMPFETSQLEKLHVVDLNLGFLLQLDDYWHVGAVFNPRLASNLISGIEQRDLKLNGLFGFWKEVPDAAKPYRLIMGLSYNSATGLPVPLPLVSYYRRFHPDWSFTLGIPKSRFRHYLNNKHLLETALFLDGYFVNIQNEIPIMGEEPATSISLSALAGTIGYQYNFTARLSFFAMSGYTFVRSGKLRDEKRNNIYSLNEKGSLYLRAGVKLSIVN